MTGVVIVVLVAVCVALVAGVAVSVLRLRGVLATLRAEVTAATGRVRPQVDELTEATQVTGVEAAALQGSIARLRGDGRD